MLALFVFLCLNSCSVKPPTITSLSSVDAIFFKEIDRVTAIANLNKLRSEYVPSGDVEVRIWRGFGLSPLEGVALRRTNGTWTGVHLIADQYFEATAVQRIALERPKSGWKVFESEVVRGGLLQLPKTPEAECDRDGIDGIGYLVEVNQDRTYRNYYYRDGNKDCRESDEMSRIGESIGLEFDDGTIKCTEAQWFPCMTYRKARGIR